MILRANDEARFESKSRSESDSGVVKYTLVVATIGRRAELAALLASLANQSFREFEVIVVDQNPEGFIDDVISDYSSVLRIAHLRTNRRGASLARNIGLETARGQIVTFPDDDCEYPPDLLAKVDLALDQLPEFAGISVASRDKQSVRRIVRFSGKAGELTKFNLLNRCVEFGIFLRRESLAKSRFDELMGVGAEHSSWWSDEGPDLLLSMMNEGMRIYYVPEILIFHPDPVFKFDGKAIRRSFMYGCGRGHYLRKHRYPLWYVIRVWGLYVVGAILGICQLNPRKAKYYWSGLQGRIKGYVQKLPEIAQK